MQHERGLSLPEPDAGSAAHSVLVADFIRARIAAAGGDMSFADFMQIAQYAPGLGYYSAGAAKLGAAGDFVTAPEISSVFSRVLARQVAEVLVGVDKAAVLEFGAGSGRLAADMLQALAGLGALPASYRILDVSADLRERQRRHLEDVVPELVERVVWLDTLPEAHDGVIIANEVLDALPAVRFVVRENGIAELRVAAGDEGFVFVERDAGEMLTAAVRRIESDIGRQLPVDYASEVSLALPAWVGGIARSLRRGVALLIDYGVIRREYYAADRSGGWLRCHYRHRVHLDPLILPGIQDLSAWVDFSAVADAAVAGGLEIAGFLTQAEFLIGGGLDQELAGLADMSVEKRAELSAQVKLLTLPAEMGESVKFLGLCRGDVPLPSAFTFADRTQSL